MGDIPEVVPLQETGLRKHSKLCVGQTNAGKLSCNIVTGVTVLMTQSVTHVLPSGLHKVRYIHMNT